MCQTTNSLVVTVSQLNRRVAMLIKGDRSLLNLSVSGEVSNFSVKDGHFYFSLTEKTGAGETFSVKAVMFKSAAQKLGFKPENGMSVIVSGNVQCYEYYGIYQIYVSSIIPAGEGARAVALKQLSDRLRTEGIFSRKRELPEYPRKVCVITSESGAVLHDICENINPLVELVLIPVSVQGEKAPESICKAFELANGTDAQLIIFGRGGGSAEDLSAFNDEKVVRAVFNSRIPTISAVGHETDHSLTDYAADASASTPTAAAKLASPGKEEVLKLLENESLTVKQRFDALVSERERAADQVFLQIRTKSPRRRIASYEQLFGVSIREISSKTKHKLTRSSEQLEFYSTSIKKSVCGLIADREKKLTHCVDLICEKDPMKILSKGYSAVYKDGRVAAHVSQLSVGDSVEIKMNGGSAFAEITGVRPKGDI